MTLSDTIVVAAIFSTVAVIVIIQIKNREKQ